MSELWTDDYDVSTGIRYRTHRDGRVVAMAPEVSGNRANLWRATTWDRDPRVHPDALSEPLCADVTRDELRDALRTWAEGV